MEGFPSLKWQIFDKKRKDSELYNLFYSLYKQLPHDIYIILYGRQRYNIGDEWEYFTVHVTLEECENDISKFNVIFEWDYDEGQDFREWIAFADLDNIGTYDAGAEYKELEKIGDVPKIITLNRQRLDRIAQDLKRITMLYPDMSSYLDINYVIDDIANISKVLQDFEKYLDDLNAGGV